MPGAVPSVFRHLGTPWPDRVDVPGLDRGGSLEDAEHRRRIKLSLDQVAAITLARLPASAAATADVTVSSSTYAQVPGLSLEYRAIVAGDLAVRGALYIEEMTAGELGVRIVSGSTVLWELPTIREQSASLLRPHALGKWQLPIGGPGLLAADGDTAYAVAVEVAAPAGSFAVLSGAESWVEAQLNPALGVS